MFKIASMWFLMGLVKLPNTLAYFKLGFHNVLRLLKIEESDVDNLLRQQKYIQIVSSGLRFKTYVLFMIVNGVGKLF